MPGTRKAALLLACLDPGTAAELLKGARPEIVTEIAAEMVSLEATNVPALPVTAEATRDFVAVLYRPKAPAEAASLVRRILETAVGPQRSQELLGQARRIIESRDPFRAIRGAKAEELAEALAGEHPQVAALVLIELPPDQSAALVPLLADPVRREAVRRMTSGETVPPEARVRVAAIVRNRLEAARKKAAAEAAAAAASLAPGVDIPAAPSETKSKINPRHRQVALLLRGLPMEMRDQLVKSISEHDADVGADIQNSMVLWDDLPLVSDKNTQAVLRNVDARKLAIAMVDASAAVIAKVRGNISERAGTMIDEETQLMKTPKADEIEEAREAILAYLRQLNASGELRFEGK